LRAAAGTLAREPAAKVAVIAVEVCSAAFYLDDDPGVLISLCLFGDGASASIWTGQEAGAQARLGGFDTIHRPDQREYLRFENRGGKLRNKLHRCVPACAAEAVETLYRRTFGNAGGSQPPERLLSHAGGRDVLDALEAAAFHPDQHAEARAILRDCGNLSSPSILFALKRALQGAEGARPDPGDRLWITSFGAGFACHSALATVL
jgi:alkylresorcinol/alkylpyrone synthase